MRKVLLVGGAGFIGKRLALMLVENGIEVRILDSLSPQIHGNPPKDLDWIENANIEFLRGSINCRATLKKSLIDVSDIVNLAAETGTGQSMYKIEQYNYTNCQGTALLMDIIVNDTNLGIDKLILASSRSVYGEGAYKCSNCATNERFFPIGRNIKRLKEGLWDPVCIKCKSKLLPVPTLESDPTQPESIYAATKLMQEDLVRIGCQARSIPFAILRFQNVYGEGQSLENPYTGILSIFSTKIRHGYKLPIFEDGNETRDFVHVDDVSKTIYECLTQNVKLDGIINVGSGRGTSIKEVASILIDCFHSNTSLEITSEFRIGDIRHNVADIKKLNDVLNFKPSIDLKTGLERFVEWVGTQPLKEDKSDFAKAELLERDLMK